MGLSHKVKAAIDRMVFDAVARPEAAEIVGLADTTLRLAFRNPVVVKHYREQMVVLRESERPRSVNKIVALRDKAESERVQLDAAKYLDGQDRAGPANVGVQVVNIVPGYQIGISSDMADKARQILQQSGSVANVLDLKAAEKATEPAKSGD